jgi:hypothetical protein
LFVLFITLFIHLIITLLIQQFIFRIRIFSGGVDESEDVFLSFQRSSVGTQPLTLQRPVLISSA